MNVFLGGDKTWILVLKKRVKSLWAVRQRSFGQTKKYKVSGEFQSGELSVHTCCWVTGILSSIPNSLKWVRWNGQQWLYWGLTWGPSAGQADMIGPALKNHKQEKMVNKGYWTPYSTLAVFPLVFEPKTFRTNVFPLTFRFISRKPVPVNL